MDLAFGLSAFERTRGGLPQLPVVNMFAEAAPTEKVGIILQSRPGLQAVETLGDDVQALFLKDGVLSGQRFAVVDVQLYNDSTLVGAVTGDGPFFMDGYETLLFIAGGASLWGYNGTTLSSIALPDGADVAKVVVGGSRAICLRADTQRFYWSTALGSTFASLSFATAESQPDRLRDMLFIDDTLVLFGAETVEFWPNTGDSDLPFQPLEGRVFERGIRATGCAAIFDASFVWVGDDNVVYQNGAKPEPISNEGLQEKIAASEACRLWTYTLDGIEFLALRLDDQTYVRSAGSGLWSENASFSEDNWLPQCFADGQFGTADGRIARFSTVHTDFGGVMERRFRAGVAMDSGGLTLNNLILRTNPGTTPILSGTYSNPTVELHLSRDAGKTWGNWKGASLGTHAEYRSKVQWTGLGMFGQPGLLAEFRLTDPVPFRVSGVLANEPFGGI
jgi:hypothetical protein